MTNKAPVVYGIAIFAALMVFADQMGKWLHPEAQGTGSVSTEEQIVTDPNDPRYDLFADDRRQNVTLVCPDQRTINALYSSRAKELHYLTSGAFVAMKLGICCFRRAKTGDNDIMPD